ncbi:hypothetical protein MHU86_8273 [Fragilaria crotonensis]|nr:hypothetical protein MHU86_8273 [Fragilaria crotonensis]
MRDDSDGTLEEMEASIITSTSDQDLVLEHQQTNASNSVKKSKELFHVVDWFSRATNGNERFEVVMLEGYPGEKKSQLLLELQDELESHNARVIRLKNDRTACSHQMAATFDFYDQLIDLCKMHQTRMTS